MSIEVPTTTQSPAEVIFDNRVRALEALRDPANAHLSQRFLYRGDFFGDERKHCAMGFIYYVLMGNDPATHDFDHPAIVRFLGLSMDIVHQIEWLHDNRAFSYSQTADAMQLLFALFPPKEVDEPWSYTYKTTDDVRAYAPHLVTVPCAEE